MIALVADLIFASRITGAAKAAGRSVTVVRSADALAAKLDDSIGLAFIDLDVDDAMEAIQTCATANPRPRIIAFGAHVDKDALTDAKSRGADEALPRSAFVARLEDLL